jgi:2-C-methyl-D-erythritol 2,4-cyclodiphosphate synthase
MALLTTVARLIRAAGWWVNNIDVTVIAQDVRVAPHRAAITAALVSVLKTEAVSIKATTTDAMGFTGRGEGLAALAVVTVTL